MPIMVWREEKLYVGCTKPPIELDLATGNDTKLIWSDVPVQCLLGPGKCLDGIIVGIKERIDLI